MAFIAAFQMEEVDHEARIVELHFELANLKQGETENCRFYCRFYCPSRHFSKKAPWFSGRGYRRWGTCYWKYALDSDESFYTFKKIPPSALGK